MIENLIRKAEKYKDLMADAEKYIWEHPETGYKEFKTSKYMEEAFEKLGYTLTKAEGITGFYTVIDTGRPGPEVMILGELDSLICANHPEADPETGAVHSCGHCAQCGALLGIAAALSEPDALDDLCGRIRLCAVPAEELIEVEYRSELKKAGKIRYFGGKSEFLYRGYFDGVDIAFMVHTGTGQSFTLLKGHVGCIAKTVTYKGVSSHAGGAPWNGCNALYAATSGLAAINAIRETFRDSEHIRVHPIITEGGTVVNAIPERATLESFVRGKTFPAILEANERVNRALCGSALSLGANVDIHDFPGYAPLEDNDDLLEIAREATELFPELPCHCTGGYSSGSTDMGDLSCIMPVIHPSIGGAKGIAHGADYYIENTDLACTLSAKWQLAILYKLLSDGGKKAKEVIRNFKPQFASKEEYFAYIDGFTCEGDRITYDEKTATVRL